MSQENVEALMRAVAGAQDRPDAFFALFDEDVVWDAGDVPGGKRYGRDEVREFFREWVGAFDDWTFDVAECIGAGNSVFTHIRQSGRGKTSGVPVQLDLWLVWLFFEGKVVRYVAKPNRQAALEAAGLRE